MKKYLPFILFTVSVVFVIALDIYRRYLVGMEDFDSMKTGAFLMVMAGVVAGAVGYFLNLSFNGFLGMIVKEKQDKFIQYVLPKLFAFVMIGMGFFGFGQLLKGQDDYAIKKCFDTYDEKGRIQHCITSGEMVPEIEP